MRDILQMRKQRLTGVNFLYHMFYSQKGQDLTKSQGCVCVCVCVCVYEREGKRERLKERDPGVKIVQKSIIPMCKLSILRFSVWA